MGRLLRLLVTFGVPVLMIQAGRWDLAGLWAVALGGMYAYSVAFLPWVPCLVCKGSGARTHSGVMAWLWPSAFGNCWRCHGAKGRVRLGIRVFQPERAMRVALAHG
jgi:hypothetical protein